MTDTGWRELEQEQAALMQRYAEIEANPELYADFQARLDDLDARADAIRRVLEGEE